MYLFKYPSLISVFVTNECNLRCRHCCFDSGVTKTPEMSTEALRQVIDKITGTGIVCLDFSGGEPFVRGDFLEILRYAYERGIKSISIGTNMLAITEQKMRQLKDLQDQYRLLYLRVSLDGAQPETHDWLRGRGTHAAALAAVEALRRCGVNVREMNTVVSTKSYGELDDVVGIARGFGIKTAVFLPLVPVGRAGRLAEFMITPEQWRTLCARKHAMEERFGMEVFADSPVSTTLDARNIGKSLPCMCGHQFLGILPNGQYSICPIVANNGESSAFQQDIGEFWAKSRLLSLVRDLDALEGECADCRYKELCRGGCRGLAYSCHGSWTQPDPMCWVRHSARSSAKPLPVTDGSA